MAVQGIRRRGIDCVQGKDDGDNNEGLPKCREKRGLSIVGAGFGLFAVSSEGGDLGLRTSLSMGKLSAADYGWREAPPTGVSGGEVIVGRGSNVDTAGALVSPLISAPIHDFLLGRGVLSFDRGLILDAAEWLDCKSGKGSRLEDILELKALPNWAHGSSISLQNQGRSPASLVLCHDCFAYISRLLNRLISWSYTLYLLSFSSSLIIQIQTQQTDSNTYCCYIFHVVTIW
jgi:hypothetical protein